MITYQGQNVCVEVKDTTGFLWLDVAGRSHNVFNRQVLADLDEALANIAAVSPLNMLVVASKKPSGFMAGADLQEFMNIKSSAEAEAISANGQSLFDRLAGLPMPTVAVLHGPCLGGGLEFPLACDYRVVIDHPTTQLGLPEVELGLLPGWGGTQRLPRTIGLERAFHVILMRRRLNAREALAWSLADAGARNQEDALAALAGSLGQKLVKQGKAVRTKLPLRTWRQRMLESTNLGRWLLFRGAERIARRRVWDDMPAPFEALEAMRVGLTQGMQAGLKFEREAAGRLAMTPACRNLLSLFFLTERARKGELDSDSVPPEISHEIRRVGVVGAGAMGAGIAQLAALKGREVIVQEINDAALVAGLKKIEDLFQKAVERRLLSAEEARKKLASLGRTTTYEGFDSVDLVIEAAIEDLDKKRAIFRELDRRTRPDAVLATNTSSLAVNQLQEGLIHPERLAGLHFFNPVHKMPLVEVVQTPTTEDGVIASLRKFASSLGKTPVIVQDSPGFVVNRILMPYLYEGVQLLADGTSAKQIDGVMKKFGMPMGPLELLDQIGLDIAAHVARGMQPANHLLASQQQFMASRERKRPETPQIFETMCKKGWLGQKAGKGFYTYKGKKKQPNHEIESLLGGAQKTEANPSAIRDRLVLLMVNEAAACLGEGIAANAETIDLAMVLGTGWAPHRGGPLRYADDRGIGMIVGTLENFAKKFGGRFEPCAELERRGRDGELFYGAAAVAQAG